MHRFSISKECVSGAYTESVRAFRIQFAYTYDCNMGLIVISVICRKNQCVHTFLIESEQYLVVDHSTISATYDDNSYSPLWYESISEFTLKNRNRNSYDIIFNICNAYFAFSAKSMNAKGNSNIELKIIFFFISDAL